MSSKIYPLAVLAVVFLYSCGSSESGNAPADATSPAPSAAVPQPEKAQLQNLLSDTHLSSKGIIESVAEVPIFSRIAGQITSLNVELGQRVRKGQVLVRLDESDIRAELQKREAELEQADYQYQSILMGQGYKRAKLDEAPEEIRKLARVNSGYNTALAAVKKTQQQLEFCTITAPISGAVSDISATLYGAANPGESLFYVVDTEHLKASFDVLENEMSKFSIGSQVEVITVAYPGEVHNARVTAISPSVEKTGMIHMEAELKPSAHLMPGMTAIITLK
ncbi:MAG: efflux RND transporter periplasmic adaptor subunit [Bacteroidales bacterium]|nr:efflux RND transporter periplasmic adaptor subunit [Bacteroidales bacterium]